MEGFLKLKPMELNRRINEFSPLKIDVKLFSASHLWEIPNEDLYPDEILERIKEEIRYLKALITDFARSDYSPKFFNRDMKQFSLYRTLALELAEHENIVDALIYSNYYKNSPSSENIHSFKIAQIMVFLEHLKYREIPHSVLRIKKFEVSYRIYRAIKAGTWSRYNTWNKFLEGLYGKNWFELVRFLEEFPFEKLIKELPYLDNHLTRESRFVSSNFLRELKEKNSKEIIRNLYDACQLGFYEKDGIYSWHELLYWCQNLPSLKLQFNKWDLGWNNKFNCRFHDFFLSDAFSIRYSSRKGLEIIAQDLYNFTCHFGRYPTQFDFPFVLSLLDMCRWEKYSIFSWEHLVEYSRKLKV